MEWTVNTCISGNFQQEVLFYSYIKLSGFDNKTANYNKYFIVCCMFKLNELDAFYRSRRDLHYCTNLLV